MAECIYCNNDDFVILVDKPDYQSDICISEVDSSWIKFPLLIVCCRRSGKDHFNSEKVTISQRALS